MINIEKFSSSVKIEIVVNSLFTVKAQENVHLKHHFDSM